ncbi:MAG: dinitrogenase iron-molybdenum cofactor biosynthesis protein [Magnetococcales bacterium]|nr:dinitrogenase iron-molybdenum cofactor biosynthesis protein [Magnetococcales bacterium]MBF0322795.1 dinitrogenase iron-molybdenum cofactor biosynthesis protein [Magnetococcales bacterium]
MRIAVTSQNKYSITEHAGQCRRFWLFDVENNVVSGERLVELAPEESFHNNGIMGPDHPLFGMHVLITRSMGQGLKNRLAGMGVQGVVTSLEDPKCAAILFLEGKLPSISAPDTRCNGHGHGHGNGCGPGPGLMNKHIVIEPKS